MGCRPGKRGGTTGTLLRSASSAFGSSRPGGRGVFAVSERSVAGVTVKSTRFGTIGAAAAWAEQRSLRQRAVCYVTRGAAVLALRHLPKPADHNPLPGIQLPAGGVNPGETPGQAAVREAFEETGLKLDEPIWMGSCLWSREGWTGPDQIWHYFQLTAPPGTPDAWSHTVTSGDADAGSLYELHFTTVLRPDLTLGQGSHEYLPELSALLESTTRFSQLSDARAHAQRHQLREKAVCHVTRGAQLLVFDHLPDDSGVQVPAGGVEAGETPAEAASREVREETGRSGFGPPHYLGSAVWINAEHHKRELRHFFYLLAPPNLPDAWQHHADNHLFAFRWAALSNPELDWNFDVYLPTPTGAAHD